jgi:hypothetical protein
LSSNFSHSIAGSEGDAEPLGVVDGAGADALPEGAGVVAPAAGASVFGSSVFDSSSGVPVSWDFPSSAGDVVSDVAASCEGVAAGAEDSVADGVESVAYAAGAIRKAAGVMTAVAAATAMARRSFKSDLVVGAYHRMRHGSVVGPALSRGTGVAVVSHA